MLFLLKCLAVSLAAFSLLLLLNYRYLQVMEEPYSDADKFHYMDSSYNNIQICNIGSSHGEYAFTYKDLTKEQGYEPCPARPTTTITLSCPCTKNIFPIHA